MTNLSVEDRKDSESEDSNIISSKDADSDKSNVDADSKRTPVKSKNLPSQIKNTIKSKMYILCRELFFLLMLMFTYAAFQNNTPKVSNSPHAFPFFPTGSVVKDWYRGQLNDAIELASESDLAFVMYYAPWDAESQAVRHEFNIAAQHMHKYVHFAAINCWHPGSECQQQYSKVYTWPVLMIYPAHGRGIQYRGPKKAEYMMKFLQIASNPIIRIKNLAEVGKYQAFKDAVIVGGVDAKLGSPNYGIFYSASLRFLERDPFRDVQFLVVTEAVGSFTDNNIPFLRLYLWNETLIYPATNKWQPEPIVSWIADNVYQLSVWATPSGTKSQSLGNYLQPGPTLILFTPRNPLYTHIDYYTVLREVALDYYNCDNNVAINIQRALIWFSRRDYNLTYKQLKSKCLPNKKLKKDQFPTVVTYDNKIWLNNTCDLKQSIKKVSTCQGSDMRKDTCLNVIHSFVPAPDKRHYHEKKKIPSDIKTEKNDNDIFVPDVNNDFYSPLNLQKIQEHEKCHYFRIANNLQKAIFAPLEVVPEKYNYNISGLACKTNKSLSILAIDSLQFHHFAENFGIDILNRKDKSAVVILNPTMETHYLMDLPVSTSNLYQFIDKFTKGTLDRTLNSALNLRQFTHSYLSHEFCVKNQSNNICLDELNSTNFMTTILQQDVAVVVMYYSKKCSFCSGVSYNLLTAARLLSSVKNLQFARIDGDKHALPWEYTMPHYPSILFFPARRKSESRVFPQNVPITVQNLLSFILANIEPHTKLKVMWTLCRKTSFADDFEDCIRTVRSECMIYIGKLLRTYRLSNDTEQRAGLLKKLQVLRSLHFSLAKPLNMDSIQKYIKLLRLVDASSSMEKLNNHIKDEL